jgi:hypothetical protein
LVQATQNKISCTRTSWPFAFARCPHDRSWWHGRSEGGQSRRRPRKAIPGAQSQLMHSGRGMDREKLGLDSFDSGETMGPGLWRQ